MSENTNNLKYEDSKFSIENAILDKVEGAVNSSTGEKTITLDSNLKVLGSLDISGATYSLCQSPEWIKVLVDSQERIIAGVRTDGSVYIGQLEGLDDKLQEMLNAMQAMLDEAEAEIDAKLEVFNSVFNIVDNPEWIQVTTDSEGKILEGITTEGKKKVMVDVDVQGNEISTIDNPEFSSVLLDKNKKVINGVRQNGATYIADIDNPTVDYLMGLVKEFIGNNVATNEINSIEGFGTPETCLSLTDEEATGTENMYLGYCQVLKMADNLFYMYYDAFGSDDPRTTEFDIEHMAKSIHFAYSTDGLHWVREFPSSIENPPQDGVHIQFFTPQGLITYGYPFIFRAPWDNEFPFRAVTSEGPCYIYKSVDGVTFTHRKLIDSTIRDTQPAVILRGNVLKIYDRFKPIPGRRIAVSYCDIYGNVISPSRYLFGSDNLYQSSAGPLDDRRDILFPTTFRQNNPPHDPQGLECYIVDGNKVQKVDIDENIFTENGRFKQVYIAPGGVTEINRELYLYYNVSECYHDVVPTEYPSIYTNEIRRIKIEFGNKMFGQR